VKEGPAIEELTRHLAECPRIFLAEPVQPNGNGEVHVQAVVADLMRALGQAVVAEEKLRKFKYGSVKTVPKSRNRLRVLLIGCWLASHPELREHLLAEEAFRWLESGLDELAGLVKAESLVSDPERREELSRILMSVAQVLPRGETEKEAENRLDSLDTVKRDSVVRQAQAAQERARELREEMARKERERRAASVYNHE
jgi:hypothetical protein